LYALNLPALEPRLQRRYQQLVMQHLAPTDYLAAGWRALPETTGSLAAAQAAWRYYRNERVSLPALSEPLIVSGRAAVAAECERFALSLYDWSVLGFARHASKTDRVAVRTKAPVGYELLTALLLSDRTGQPLAPLCQELRAAGGVLSTRAEQRLPARQHLNAVGLVMAHVKSLDLGKPASI